MADLKNTNNTSVEDIKKAANTNLENMVQNVNYQPIENT